ncbi:MAG: HAD family phosphatase [Pirellulaceae bacterium]|jgi:pseudouridine-5'-monophosphatase|nr:HAD family phosphatase [Pirellulaceae bacterium]
MNVWAHTIRGVAFDMDGLMVNTEELYSEVGEILLSRRDRRFSSELKAAMMGLPGPQAFAVMIERERLSDTHTTLALESDEIFVELLPSKLQTLPGLEELLERLDRLQLPRCIATSSPHHFVRSVLEIVELEDRFDFVVTAEDVEHGKPAPDIYVEAARRMGIDAPQMLVLEDSHHGTRAGIASGACTVAVPGVHSLEHDFSGVALRAASLADARIAELLS